MDPVFTYYYGGVFAILFGAAIGSFMNVVIYRLPLEMSLASPPSRCGSCETPVKWYDNLPIISWFILRGKCRHCDQKYSFRYAAIEILVAGVAGYLWFSTMLFLYEGRDLALGPPLAVVVLKFTFVAWLIVLTFIDLDHLLLPHKLTFPGMAIGLSSPWILQHFWGNPDYLLVWPPVTPMMSLTGWLAGAISIALLIGLYYAATGMQGMGGGDITLMAMLGAWLGWPALFFICFASSLQGLVAAGLAKVFMPDFIQDSEEVFRDEDEPIPEGEELPKGKAAIPFGPFLALAGIEFALFGHYLPDSLSMRYLYF